MCAILDANVVTIVFGGNCPPAAQEFRSWIESGRGRLAIGGLLRRELSSNETFRSWLQQALLGGRIKSVPDGLVDREADELTVQAACESNDQHIVALARVSGARLLYSRDQNLREDFKNPNLLSNPKGKLYPESQGSKCRRWLLRQSHICGE